MHALAESPVWDPTRDRALWVDIDGRRAWAATWPRLDPASFWESERKVCAVLPADDGGMLVVESDRLVHLDADGVVQSARVVPLEEGRRFNDATCDPRGRLVLGTLRGDGESSEESLMRLDSDGRLRTLREGLSLSNGIGYSPDGRTMYHVDTLRHRVDILDDDGQNVVLRGSFELISGYPDGIALDVDGDIWVATGAAPKCADTAPTGRCAKPGRSPRSTCPRSDSSVPGSITCSSPRRPPISGTRGARMARCSSWIRTCAACQSRPGSRWSCERRRRGKGRLPVRRVPVPRPSPLTLGTSGRGRAAWEGTAGRKVAVDLAVAMLESRHALLDTANEYDGGRSEEVIGIALRHAGVTGPVPVVTKVDRDLDTGVFDRDRVLRSYDESLAQLGVDRVSLLHLHDPFTITFAEASAPDGAIAGLIELRDAGAVDGIGIAAGPIPMVRPFVETGLFDAVLVHNRFTIVDQSARELFSDARSRGMTVFNAAPFGAGLLAKGSASGARYGYSDTTAQLRAWWRRPKTYADGIGSTSKPSRWPSPSAHR